MAGGRVRSRLRLRMGFGLRMDCSTMTTTTCTRRGFRPRREKTNFLLVRMYIRHGRCRPGRQLSPLRIGLSFLLRILRLNKKSRRPRKLPQCTTIRWGIRSQIPRCLCIRQGTAGHFLGIFWMCLFRIFLRIRPARSRGLCKGSSCLGKRCSRIRRWSLM